VSPELSPELAFATEGNKMLGVAVVASHAQEAMFQAPAFEVGFEFAQYIATNREILNVQYPDSLCLQL
jgi:hypothetical protein